MSSYHNDYHERRASAHRREKISSIISTIVIILAAPLFALTLVAFVFQSYQVDGQSMETTLQNNDRLLVWKLPKTWSRITNHDYTPNRGDVVVFTVGDLKTFGPDSNKQLIKRVIALPGERVVVRDKKVIVYNKAHPKGFSPDATLPYGKVIVETLGEQDMTVPQGKIFVLGDNRDNSLDSRVFGPISVHDVVGKLILRVWPLQNAKTF